MTNQPLTAETVNNVLYNGILYRVDDYIGYSDLPDLPDGTGLITLGWITSKGRHSFKITSLKEQPHET